MNASDQQRKTVAVFDPEARSRAVIIPMLEGLGYAVDEHHTAEGLLERASGEGRADVVFLHLAVFGDTYQTVTQGLASLGLASLPEPPAVLAISALKISEEARSRLRQLGCTEVLSRQVPLAEVLFAINRLLFPKIRELRRYTRVFGGFPVRFGAGADMADGQVYNLSREGAFVQCAHPPAEGTRIKVQFVLPGLDDAPLEIDALVSWINRDADQGDPLSPSGMGVSFLSMDPTAQTTLGRFIATREPEPPPET